VEIRMKNGDKTKKYLVNELERMRQRSAKLEILEAKHRQAMAALRESEGRYSTLFEKTVNPIIVSDIEGNFVDCNEAALQFLECTRHELMEKNMLHFVTQDPETGLPEVNMPIWDSNGSMETEFLINGRLKLLELAVTPLTWQGRQVVFGLGKDVTERKLAEAKLKEYSERLEEMVEERTRELRETQAQLVRREKLATLGQLAGGVGHELRNPLGAIKNAAYFLNMVMEDGEAEVKETLEIIEREIATSERIISGLLDFARTKPPNRERVNIKEIIRQSLSRSNVPEGIELVVEIEETIPEIEADPIQLGQVFVNMATNAIQAMPDGGRLEVRAGLGRKEVEVSFTDSGVGIPAENLEKIFEPLFTSKAKGIGLGLAVIKAMIEGHGGKIEVDSEEGRGSTFSVKLPQGEES
jgi:PAS domain S-box-containing protein